MRASGLAIGGRALEQAVDYLRKACEMDARRCFRFGTMAMPYGAKEAIKALVRSCHETDMLAGCIMLAKYHEKELREISGEAEVKRLYAPLRAGAARGALPKSAVNLAKFAVFGFDGRLCEPR